MYFRYTQHISLLTKNEQQIPKTGVACSIQPKILGSELLTSACHQHRTNMKDLMDIPETDCQKLHIYSYKIPSKSVSQFLKNVFRRYLMWVYVRLHLAQYLLYDRLQILTIRLRNIHDTPTMLVACTLKTSAPKTPQRKLFSVLQPI